MKTLTSILLCLALLICGCGPKKDTRTIRVAVIGGMVMTGMWQQLAEQFEKDTGYKIVLVVTGSKEMICPPFRNGEIDLLTMHSSDDATGLVSEGYAVNIRPWTWNEQVIVGPSDDPAGIRGMKDGSAALKKIAETQSHFVDAQGGGKRLVAEKLWAKAGIRPAGEWLIKDESDSPSDLLHYAESKHAYVICGRAPVLWKKIPKSGGMEILVQGDPNMQRPFVVIEANPKHFSHANIEGARALSDYLVGESGQAFLANFKADQSGIMPVFYPLAKRDGN
ncbi:MAG: substrate-binding domain-containing protein [Chthoniobacterales bacterium]